MTGDAVRVAVIMAGGSGERFWPLSRGLRPKQLLNLASAEESLLGEAVSRITPLIPASHVFVQTSTDLAEVIHAGEPRVPKDNVFAEPCRRNTAGCLIWAAASLRARYGANRDICMAVLTADHRIGSHDNFRATVGRAMTAAEEQDALVTIGVKPERADTGFGYIEVEPGTQNKPVTKVCRFREKPGSDLAEEFVKAGNFFWNSGMFFWRVSTFFAELENAQPEMAAIGRAITNALLGGDEKLAVAEFEKLKSVSIDYALMERAEHVMTVPAEFPWDDVGSWDSLDRTRREERDDRGNVAIGDPVILDCRDTIVFNESGAKERAVGVVGLQNVVVVAVGDAVLVVDKDRVQDVRKIVAELKRRGAGQV